MLINTAKEQTKQINKKDNFLKIYIHKDNVVATTQESALFKATIENDVEMIFWIRKIFLYEDKYSNLLQVSINKEYIYNVYNAKRKGIDWKVPDQVVKGIELFKVISDSYKDYNNLPIFKK